MKLLVQPQDGVLPVIQGINRAKHSVEIVIFRFDHREIERALAAAVGRGVFVHALIAYTNRGGERNLRKLEMRLLAAGVTVARTADDLARYHSKFLIIDRKELFVLGYNFTYLDIEHTRSFGIITRTPKLVSEAVRLFEADTKRQPYTGGQPGFVVSPVNARNQLAAFIRGARKQLLIYDPEISDDSMIRILDERAKAGVEIRIIGRLPRASAKLSVRKLGYIRLHTRTLIRDGQQAFIGSQSLREVELAARREVGIIFRDKKIVARIMKLFEEDWTASGKQLETSEADMEPVAQVAKRVAKAITKDLPPVTPVLQVIVRELGGDTAKLDLDPKEVEETVKDAVKEAVRDVVRDVVGSVVEQDGVPI
ncbi:MAG TPA: phospholipase D-like domain-containing protein [Bryobacteraceae bacterium]|nr:phospholipase D-like domain-containing protein [Bryobacteraceae bacterium]